MLQVGVQGGINRTYALRCVGPFDDEWEIAVGLIPEYPSPLEFVHEGIN